MVSNVTEQKARWGFGDNQPDSRLTRTDRSRTGARVTSVAAGRATVDPIKALYWTAVINGVVAVPVTVMMLMTAQPRIMGKFVISGWLRWLGWASTLAMAACVTGMIISWFG